MKNLLPLTLIFFFKKQLVRTDCSEAVLISFFALCSLEPMFHFYCSSMGGDADSLTQGRQDTNHPSQNTQSHTFTPLSALLCDQHTSMYALWSEVEKNGSKSENHKSQTGYSVSTITSKHVQAHVCIHTTQTELSGLCSHQCVQLDRERKMGGIVEGVRRSN